MTKEELQEFNSYREASNLNLKDALKQQGVTYWSYYKARRQTVDSSAGTTENIPGAFIPVVFSEQKNSKIVKPGRRSRRETELAKGNILTIEMRTPTGTELRIQGQMNISMLREILITTSGGSKDV